MDRLLRNVEEELKKISEKQLNISDIPVIGQLVDIYKDLKEVQEKDGGEYGMRRYRDGGYDARNDGGYGRGGRGYGGYDDYDGEYGRRGVPGSGRRGGRYGADTPLMRHMDRVHDGLEMYEDGREYYRAGGNESRLIDGLEEMMYGLCMFVEKAMEFAETPQEKEIIRKHVQKIKNI